MRIRWCISDTSAGSLLDQSDEFRRNDYYDKLSFSTPNPTMAESSSPASVPSLAAISTDGDDSLLQLMNEHELPANPSSKSYSVAVEDHQFMVDSWKAIVDDDEDDLVEMASQYSSGILSQETLDMDFEVASTHSLSSAKTLKSPTGRTNDEDDDGILETVVQPNEVQFEHVREDVPVNRACHGALNISPKQLAEVFAMFSADRKKEGEDTKQEQDKEEGEPPQSKESTETIPPCSGPTFVAATCTPQVVAPSGTPQENPFSIEERFKSRSRAAHPKLTSELYWKPRAKNLELECETLKEILTDDSSKILQLKSALETLRGDRLRSLEDIEACQEKLEAAEQELDNLKKEREVLLENETEYRETIRILKNEVDIMTRDGNYHQSESPKEETAPKVDLEELQQLRLENQLFAAQIVDYEAELERLEQQQQSQSSSQDNEDEEETRANDSAARIEAASDKLLEEAFKEADQESSDVVAPNSAEAAENIPFVEDVTPSMEEEGIESVGEITTLEEQNGDGSTVATSGRKPDSNRTQITVVRRVADDSEEEAKAEYEDEGNNPDCMERLASEIPTSFPQQIIGNVLGMFTVSGTDENKEADKQEVFVIHDTAPTTGDKVHCLQWRSPDQLPTYVQVDNIVPPENTEDRNPASTGSSDAPLCDKANAPRVATQQSGTREDTAIEVLQDGENQAIEVKLNPSDLGKKKSKSSGEKCDVWYALSHCPFSSDSR